MDQLIIQGGTPLKGELKVSGSKNATLPILAATLLTDDKCTLRNVPQLRDIKTMLRLLKSLGKDVNVQGNKVTITSHGKASHIASYDLVSTMRGSFCVLGPLLAKLGKAQVSLPGGCVIGLRPVDLHVKGLKALGVQIDVDAGYVFAKAKKLKGNSIYLGGTFGPSVLATANVLMAATLAKGETMIESAACEPEIEELAIVLNKMGAKISGQGSPHIRIQGVKKLKGFDHRMSSDRIEAGTYLLLAAATKSDLVIKDIRPKDLLAVIDKLEEMGVNIQKESRQVRIKGPKKIVPASITTYPFPGFPTDLQAQFMALMALADGVSVVTEKVFPDRFMHIAELNRMGANIRRESSSAIIEGVKALHGAPVMASDLRASAALVIAGLAAKGKTIIKRIYHLERGYENLDEKLRAVGASITREQE